MTLKTPHDMQNCDECNYQTKQRKTPPLQPFMERFFATTVEQSHR
jgi:hypothetical protein